MPLFVPLAAASAPLAAPAPVPEAAGAWHGAIHLPTGDLPIVVRLQPTPGGGLAGVLVSPAQSQAEILLTEAQAQDGQLSFQVPAIRGGFQGRWDAGQGAWVGAWRQGGELPLTLVRGDLPKGPVITGLDGRWTGVLTAGNGARLRLVLRVQSGAYGTTAVLDSPDQLTYGVPVAHLQRSGEAKVGFEVPLVHGRFEGTLAGAALDGQWLQGAEPARPLRFERQAEATPAEARRPQTPKPPFPYRAEDVAFDSAPGVRLAGTLTLPPGPGPFAAAVLITGSGPQDRDETILGHKPFLVIADDLTRRGVAVLRVDDRGVGKSTGDFSKATTFDFTTDTAAAVRYLRSRADINPRRIGLIGHSEGALVAPMVAAKDRRIAFVVLLAGPAAPMGELLSAQRLALAPGMGMTTEAARTSNLVLGKAQAAMAGAPDQPTAQARALAAIQANSKDMTPAAQTRLARTISSDWFRTLLAYDPQPALRQLRMPVLALNGSKDLQVPPDQNLPRMRAALKNDPDATVLELPGLNHLFQTAPTGAVGEYADIEETVSPLALKTMGEWVSAHARH